MGLAALPRPSPALRFAVFLNNLPQPSGTCKQGVVQPAPPPPHPTPPHRCLEQRWRKPVHLPRSISSRVNHHWLTHRLCPPPTAAALKNQRHSDSSLCSSPASGWRIWHPETVNYSTEWARPWALHGEAWCVYEFKSMWSARCTQLSTAESLFWPPYTFTTRSAFNKICQTHYDLILCVVPFKAAAIQYLVNKYSILAINQIIKKYTVHTATFFSSL